MLQLFSQSQHLPFKTAVVEKGKSYTYRDLWEKSSKIAFYLLNGKTDLNQARVAFMVSPGFDYTAVQWGIWKAGGIAVPLCITYPLPSYWINALTNK